MTASRPPSDVQHQTADDAERAWPRQGEFDIHSGGQPMCAIQHQLSTAQLYRLAAALLDGSPTASGDIRDFSLYRIT